jgi:probable HAF family extracellular repeat protein
VAGIFILLIPACGGEASSDGQTAVAPSTLRVEARPDVCYSVKDLGPAYFLGLDQQTLGINAQGTVVGTTFRWSPDVRRAFSYKKGTVTDLGTLGGNLADARAVNIWGLAVGGSTNAAGAYRATAFYRGTTIDLGALDGTNSWAMDVNDFGLAVGNAVVSGTSHAAAFFLGRAFDLGTLGSETYANGVNNLGDIVGTGRKVANGDWTAFLLRHGKMTELGTVGGVAGGSSAFKINLRGTVCGHAAAPAGYHGVLWDHGETTDLGDFGGGWSFCQGLNDRGMAVGAAGDAYGGAHAFLWRSSGEGLIDLNARIPDDANRIWLFWGSNINWAGEITAYGVNFQTYQNEGYLLSPVSCPRL